ncbi:MAG TPA: cupredoxin domain-containing protein [Verrucomicrobiae bacterium]|nr:cupredoxin domain-containing protein [Verrucomicrobiae bacterium]
MSTSVKTKWVALALCAAAVAVAAASRGEAAGPPPAGDERVIVIEARRYEFSPDEIRIKKGEAVVFELHTADRKHGFLIPDFNVRADVPPGETVRVRWVPTRTGRFAFKCDLFCGSGHEDMNGTIVVE